jgi:hypothetical protein
MGKTIKTEIHFIELFHVTHLLGPIMPPQHHPYRNYKNGNEKPWPKLRVMQLVDIKWYG